MRYAHAHTHPNLRFVQAQVCAILQKRSHSANHTQMRPHTHRRSDAHVRTHTQAKSVACKVRFAGERELVSKGKETIATRKRNTHTHTQRNLLEIRASSAPSDFKFTARHEELMGTMLGIQSSLNGAAGALAPPVGGFLYRGDLEIELQLHEVMGTMIHFEA